SSTVTGQGTLSCGSLVGLQSTTGPRNAKVTDKINATDQIESNALVAPKEPTDNSKQAVKDGLEEGSNTTKTYYQKRREGMTDFDTGQMVKVGALPPKPEFFDSSVQQKDFNPAAVDAMVNGLPISDLVKTGGVTGDTVLYKNKPGQTAQPADVP